jgi:hypothetical protein
MHRYVIAALAAALVAGCAGGMNSTPSASAPGAAMRKAMAPDASGCFRFNRFIREKDLRAGVKWRLHPGMRPKKFVEIELAHNSLRFTTIKIRPWNEPQDVSIVEPGGEIRDVMLTRPSFQLVILEKHPAKDPGPGAKVNAIVCPS